MAAVETPVTIQPVPSEVKPQEQVATEAILAGAGPQIADENAQPAAVTPTHDEKTTTTIKEEVKPASPKEGRKPFAVLNNLFGRKEKTAPTTPEKDAKPELAEPVKEEAPVVEAAAPTTQETPAESTEPVAATEGEAAKKKDGFLDKLLHLVEKKEKTPKKSKDASEKPKADEAAPIAETAVVGESTGSETPVAALAEPIVLPETAVTPTPATETQNEAAKEEAKADEVKEDRKKDKTKIGRRLSARIFSSFSPKKEKTNPLEKKSEEGAEDAKAAPTEASEPKAENKVVVEPSTSGAGDFVATEIPAASITPAADAIEESKSQASVVDAAKSAPVDEVKSSDAAEPATTSTST